MPVIWSIFVLCDAIIISGISRSSSCCYNVSQLNFVDGSTLFADLIILDSLVVRMITGAFLSGDHSSLFTSATKLS